MTPNAPVTPLSDSVNMSYKLTSCESHPSKIVRLVIFIIIIIIILKQWFGQRDISFW